MSRRKVVATMHTSTGQNEAILERGHTPLPVDLAVQIGRVDGLVVGLPGERADIERAVDREVFDELNGLRPGVVIWEQVRGILSLRNEAVLQRKLDVLHTAGYVASYATLDRARFGGEPGRRVWIVGTDQRIDLPEHPRIPKRNPQRHEGLLDPVLHALLEANGL